jgi:prepilin peptidase CpaA
LQITITDVNHVVILAIVLVAVIIDWRTTKIPNLLTFPAALVGIIFNLISSGWQGALHSVAGWLIGAVVIVFLAVAPIGPKYSTDKIGMGDAKLIAAVGAFLGPIDVGFVILYFCLCFGLISIVLIARTIPWKQVIDAVQVYLITAKEPPTPVDTTRLTAAIKSPIPISIAILAATMLTIAFREQTHAFFGLS